MHTVWMTPLVLAFLYMILSFVPYHTARRTLRLRSRHEKTLSSAHQLCRDQQKASPTSPVDQFPKVCSPVEEAHSYRIHWEGNRHQVGDQHHTLNQPGQRALDDLEVQEGRTCVIDFEARIDHSHMAEET